MHDYFGGEKQQQKTKQQNVDMWIPRKDPQPSVYSLLQNHLIFALSLNSCFSKHETRLLYRICRNSTFAGDIDTDRLGEYRDLFSYGTRKISKRLSILVVVSSQTDGRRHGILRKHKKRDNTLYVLFFFSSIFFLLTLR